ncbi:MAG: hypothetical protein DRN06_07670 [Thermoprotei archaeon]|nr:MAG: hypothetical protein DRN06_07670 [Thermoprotei archaeon]
MAQHTLIDEKWREILPYILAFLLGALYRAIPEALTPVYPVGFETIAYYAPGIIELEEKGALTVFKHLTCGLTFYLLMYIIIHLTGASMLFTILKITGSILYGLLATSYMFFLRSGLNFDRETSLAATLICISLPICLRIGWDRFVNMTGLIPMYLALGLLGRKEKSNKCWCTITLLLFLAVLSRELIASVVLAALSGYFMFTRMERKRLLPILMLCYSMFFVMMLPYLGFHLFPRDERPLVLPSPAKEACPLPILINYFPEGFSFSLYIELCKRVLMLFICAYVLVMPFLIRGIFRSQLMDLMVIWLLLGGVINPLVLPFVSIPFFQRWQTLLVFPFCAYLAKGLNELSAKIRPSNSRNLDIKLVIAVPYIMLGILYSSGLISWGIEWIPPNLMQSSIEVDQIDDCIICVKWLNNNAVSEACLIVEERFRGWVLLYMKREDVRILIVYESPCSEPGVGIPGAFERAYDTAIRAGFKTIYLIWYSGARIKRFNEVYRRGSIAVYQAAL